MSGSRTLRDERTTPEGARDEHTLPRAEPFPWLSILVLGFAWFLAVAIELSPAGLLGAIAADLDVSVVAVGTMTTFYALGNALLVLPLTSLAPAAISCAPSWPGSDEPHSVATSGNLGCRARRRLHT